ncbi:MAG: ECF-type sigma factor, partial [Gammaproteobacteria bacterium]
MQDPQNITELLGAWRAGDASALDQLSPYVDAELQRLARKYMAGESAGHTLQATALVNEAFIRLVDADVAYQDRGHFFVVAARMMRRVLVDHARGKQREKRGGNAINVTLDEGLHGSTDPVDGKDGQISILDLDDALSKLADTDELMANAVEVIFFGGLSYDDAAEVL